MSENMNLKIKNFYNRWNITYDEKKQFEEFKSRVLHSFDLVLGKLFIDNENLQEEYIKLIGIIPKNTISRVHRGGMNIYNFQSVFTGYTINFNETRIWNLLNEINGFLDLIKCIQFVFWLDIEEDIKNRFFESIKKDIDFSGVQINIRKTKSGAVLYPKGAKLLDEKLVNDILLWLSDCPKAQKTFQSALAKYMEKKYNRNLVDDLRLSLELFLKQIFGNAKSLENQKDVLGTFLKNKKVPKEISGMYWVLLDRYSKYQNEYAKHDDEVNERELEFMIYLTGTFMRFLLNLGDKNE